MKKRLFALLAAAMMLFAFVACTDSSAGGSNGGGGGGGTSLDGIEIEDGAKLVYWSMWGETEPQGMVIAEAIDAFTEATGVEVEAQFSSRETRKTLDPALDAGETIDLFDEDIERVTGSWGKYLLSLDSYMTDDYLSSVNGTLMDLSKQLGDGSGTSGYYMVPYQPSAFVMFYNKDLFDAAGITELPKTWDAFLEVCQALKDNGAIPITVDDAYMGALFGYTLDRVAGSDKVAEMLANVDMSDPSVLKAAEIWQDMAAKGYMDSRAASNVFPEGQNEVAKETVAMSLNGTWLPNEVKGNAREDFRWGSFAFPAIEGGDGIEANNYGAQCFGINKNTQYPNAAFAFIKWMTTGTYDQKLADESMGVPMANDAVWPEQLGEAKAVIDSTTKRLPWAVGMEENTEIHAAIKDNFAKLILGDIDAQGFADALAAVK